MKKIKYLSLLTMVLVMVAPLQAQSRKDKKKQETTQTTPTEEAKKPVSKYARMFIQDRSCQTVKGDFMTLHRVKGKLYFELPVKFIGREMLIATTISEVSDPSLGDIGYKPRSPISIRFTQMDSTVYLTLVNNRRLNIDKESEKLKKAVDMTSLNPIVSAHPVVCYNDDKSTVVFDMTVTFSSNIDMLSPVRGTNYVFNQSASVISEIKSFEDNATVKSYLSYNRTIQGIPGVPGQPVTLKVTRTILLLPEKKMHPRIADTRVGIFTTTKIGLSPNEDMIKQYAVLNRWDLQPKDTAAYLRGELVEPAKPIIFYLDDTFPELWKDPTRECIDRWRKVFEKIGFKNAIQIRDFPKDDPNFDPDNLKYSCIRYVPAQIANAMGPSWVDPETGEVINASVIVYNDVAQLINRWRFVLSSQVDPAARAKKMPDDLMKESIAYVLTHEIGHCLGLMHNMAASASYSVDSLRSASFTQKYGTTPSIMDYARFNHIAQPGDKGVRMTPPDMGLYEEFTITYAYKPIINKTEDQERQILESWVDEKANDPRYRYGKQQIMLRCDPSALEEDLGDDPIRSADYGVKNLKYILSHINEWITDSADPDYSHRQFLYNGIVAQFNRYIRCVMLNVGGIYLTEIKAGTTDMDRVKAVPEERQREALKWIMEQLRDCQWLSDPKATKNFAVDVDAASNVRFVLSREIFGMYRNVMLSANVSEKPYTAGKFIDDLYSNVWSSTLKNKPLTESDRIIQRAFVEFSTNIVAPKPVAQQQSTGRITMEDAYAPSVEDIMLFDLDHSGVVARNKEYYTQLEAEKGRAYVIKEIYPVRLGTDFGYQRRPDITSIDNSKGLFYAENLRIMTLLNSKVSTATGENKAHYQSLIFLIKGSMGK